MNDQGLWEFVRNSLAQQVPVMLLLVVQSEGASPGKAGFKLAVTATGERCGTIGGGAMEVTWGSSAQDMIANGSDTVSLHRLHHTATGQFEKSGLICSGWQTVALIPVHTDMMDVVEQILSVYRESAHGSITISVKGLTVDRNVASADRNFAETETEFLYKENIGVLDTAYVVGCGHVGLAVSRILQTLDLRVVVFEDRPAVDTLAQNTFAHEKIVGPYDSVGKYVTNPHRAYVVVVTTAYKSDLAVLKSVLPLPVRYIGLMGSEAKTKQILSELRDQGVDVSTFGKIRNPVGFSIASHTPAEIAVSIAAEIIKERNASTE